MTEQEFFSGKDLTEQEIYDTGREIATHCLLQERYSYDDLKKYIYDNDKYNWIVYLRKDSNREFISILLRSKHKKEKERYKTEYSEAVLGSMQAKADFYKRHGHEDV